MLATQQITLVPGAAFWKQAFLGEAERIREAFSWTTPAIEHVGSTYFEDMRTKPILDVLVGLNALDRYEIIPAMAQLGYAFWEEDQHQHVRLLFFGHDLRPQKNVHVTYESSELWRELIAFRTVLAGSEAARQEYEALKLELAAKHPDDLVAYTAGKSDFVRRCLAL